MGRIYSNVYELIGNTPLVELKHIEEKEPWITKELQSLQKDGDN